MRVPNISIMENVSMSADVASDPIQMVQEKVCSIQAVWTGSPVGNFFIQISNDVGVVDPSTGLANPSSITNWTTYTGSSQAAGGSSGTFVWRLNSVPDAWVRLYYDRTSGSGTVSARAQLKGEI